MSYISTLSNKGGSVSKQGRFYDDWSSGNHAVNNTLLYRERVRVENQRLKFSARDNVAAALKHDTARMRPPPASYRSEALTTQRTTGRSILSSTRSSRMEAEEDEATLLAAQMVEAQRQLELERLKEEEEESTRLLDQKFAQITEYLAAQQKEAKPATEKPVRMSERHRQAYKVLVPHPDHGRTMVRTARLSGSNATLTERGIRRQKDFLRKESRNPRILPRKTISDSAITMSMNPKMKIERKAW